jgi:hypothetical protein
VDTAIAGVARGWGGGARNEGFVEDGVCIREELLAGFGRVAAGDVEGLED